MRNFVLAAVLLTAGQASAKDPEVVIETTKGAITIKLYADKAPGSVKNFLDYVDAKFYDGTVFHRVIPGFMVQGGGFTKELKEKPTKPTIKNEAHNGLSNKRGTLAMARTPDPDSASSQFFINLVDNVRLDFKSKDPREYGYCVFAEVTAGMDVVDAIAKVERKCPSSPPGPCDGSLPPGMMDVPKEAVVITKAYRKK